LAAPHPENRYHKGHASRNDLRERAFRSISEDGVPRYAIALRRRCAYLQSGSLLRNPGEYGILEPYAEHFADALADSDTPEEDLQIFISEIHNYLRLVETVLEDFSAMKALRLQDHDDCEVGPVEDGDTLTGESHLVDPKLDGESRNRGAA
jgi:hypothetical protein